jgi:endoglucanase
MRDAMLYNRLRAAVLHTADESLLVTASKRALRWGGNFYFPMLIGQQTTPWMLEGAVGYTITRKSDPAKARQYLAALFTTADYFLGTNALNQTWITGVGPRFPTEVFHMDAWYNGKGTYHPGLIPYSPWRKEKDQGQGPWDADWPNKTVYPAIDQWPGNERWFSNRCSPVASEFTIHQNIGPAAAIYGFLLNVE